MAMTTIEIDCNDNTPELGHEVIQSEGTDGQDPVGDDVSD